MRKAYKSLISLAVVLIAGLNFIVPAFAQDPFTAIAVGGLTGASGAGLFGSMAGMSGIDIAWSGNTADPMDAMWNVLNPDHVYFSGEKHEADPQSDPEDIYDYINVDIGDWLNAQTQFISEFCDQYGVTNNSSGTATSSMGFLDGVPVYSSLSNRSQVYTFYSPGTYKFGNGRIVFVLDSGNFYYAQWITSDNVVHGFTSGYTQNLFPCQVYVTTNGFYYKRANQSSFSGLSGTYGSYYSTNSHANINWTSGTVNKNVFNGWDSAKVKIPHNISQLQSGWTLTDFLNELDRIWSGAGEDNIIIENGAQPVPPTPIPDTPIGEVPFDDWVDLWGQGIYQQLENQSDALDLIGSQGEDAIEDLESIDSNLDELNQTAESIDTNIGVGNGILGGIRSLAQSAVDYLEGIAEHVGELVEEIVEGTETLIAGILNQIPQAFGVIFGPIKQASSIWHYVVEWIQSIGAPFQFIWSMASGTSYYIILPVYASLAAAVVLAFYKRFGK